MPTDPQRQRFGRAEEQHVGLTPQAPRPRPEFVNMNNALFRGGSLAMRAGIRAAKEALDIRRLGGQCCRVRRRQAVER